MREVDTTDARTARFDVGPSISMSSWSSILSLWLAPVAAHSVNAKWRTAVRTSLRGWFGFPASSQNGRCHDLGRLLQPRALKDSQAAATAATAVDIAKARNRVARSRDRCIHRPKGWSVFAQPWRRHSHRSSSDRQPESPSGRDSYHLERSAQNGDIYYYSSTRATTPSTTRSPLYSLWLWRKSKALHRSALVPKRSEARVQKKMAMESRMRPREVLVHTS
jgi:hypothetical protein